MNNNQKIIIIIAVVVIATGVCYFITKAVNKNAKDIKAFGKKFKKFEEDLNEDNEKNPNASISQTFGRFTKKNKDVFQDRSIRVYGAGIKEGSEASLREVVQDMKAKEKSITPESISDFIEKPIEAIPSSRDNTEEDVQPTQISDQLPLQEDVLSRGPATREEMDKKLASCIGPKELEKDLWKFHSKNSKGEYVLEYERTQELINDVCYHCPNKPTGKMVEAKFERLFTLPYLMQQIYDRHKFDDNTAHKFAQVLIDNIVQYKDRTAKSIVSNWGKQGRGKLRSELVNNPYIILI